MTHVEKQSKFKLLPPLKQRVNEYKKVLNETVEFQEQMKLAEKQQLNARKSNIEAMERAERLKQLYKLSESDLEWESDDITSSDDENDI